MKAIISNCTLEGIINLLRINYFYKHKTGTSSSKLLSQG